MLAALVAAAALVLDGAQAAQGLRAFFGEAGKRAGSLSPAQVGALCRDGVGVNLLDEQPEWGLDPKGLRVLFLDEKTASLTAPVRDAKAARRALQRWLLQRGHVGRLEGKRLIIGKPPVLKLPRSRARAWLFVQGRPPLRDAVLSLDASAQGLVAQGLVTPSSKAALLSASAPAPCAGAPLLCLRATLGPSGVALLQAVSREQRCSPPDGLQRVSRSFVLKLETASFESECAPSSHLALEPDAAPAEGAALQGQLDLGLVDRLLSRLSPLDALQGKTAAAALGAHLLYGELLRTAGPLTLQGAAKGDAAEVTLRLPLR